MSKPEKLPAVTNVVHESAPPFFESLELPPTAVAAGAEPEADMGIGMAMGLVPDFFDL